MVINFYTEKMQMGRKKNEWEMDNKNRDLKSIFITSFKNVY